MPFCPRCRDEFEDWIKVCPICNVDVVAELPMLPKPVHNKFRNEKLVTIARFANPEEAYIIAARLESAGMASCVTDEFTPMNYWIFSRGTNVQVLESNVKDALRILSSTKPDVQEVTSAIEKCPNCNSSNIAYKFYYFSFLYVMFLVILFISEFPSGPIPGRLILPSRKIKWTCNTCGYQWKNIG